MRHVKAVAIGIISICYVIVSFPISSMAQAQLPGLSQIVELYGSSTTGIITNWSTILPNGATQSYTMPVGKALVITNYDLTFYPNVNNGAWIKFVFGKPPYNKASYVFNSGPMGTWNLGGQTGFAISDINNLKLQVLDNNTGSLVPGSLEVRIFGYHISLTSSINIPSNYLLLGRNNTTKYPLLANNVK